MIVKFGEIWAVFAYKRFTYFKRRPSERSIRAAVRRHEALANV